MALALKDRVKETTIVVGTGSATLLGSSIGFQPFSVVGNGNTTYYCISDQFGSNWEVGIGTYSSSGNTLARTTVLASSNGGALVVFTAGVKDVFVTYPAEKGIWLDSSNNAIGLGTPAAFVGTNITGTASGLTAGNVTTNANLSGAVSSIGNSTSLGSFTSAQLALAISDETGTGKAVFATNPTLTSPTYAGTLTGSTDILNIGSGQIYKDASGNVGIGTSSPVYKLDIQGNTAGQFWASIKNTNAGASSIGGWFFGNDTYSDVGGVFAGSSGGGGFGGANSMNIGSWRSAPLAMFTNNTERMRIDASGNVGIGTSSPAVKLDVGSFSTASTQTIRVAAAANNDSQIKLMEAADTYGFTIRNVGASGLNILRHSADATGTTALFIDRGTGNVGIGTSSPANTLHVASGSSSQIRVSEATLAFYFDMGRDNADGLFKINGSQGSGYKWFNAGSEKMRIDSSGNLLVGTTSGSYKITCNGQPGANGYTAWTNYSDQRLKENITDFNGGLKEVLKLKPKSFNYNELSGYNEETRARTVSGFIAQELELICPEMVGTTKINDVEYLDTNTSNLNLLLVKAIQELKAIIDTQQEQINSLLEK